MHNTQLRDLTLEHQMRLRFPHLWLLLVLLILWLPGSVHAQEAAAQPAAQPAEAPPAEKPASAALYYPQLEPKQLFQILAEIYHIQFEGIDTITGPLSLISPEGRKVDLAGMLQLLNEVLAKQNKGAQLQGQIVRIVPVEDARDETIVLKHSDAVKVVELLRKRYMEGPEDTATKSARRPSLIEVHPQGSAVTVRGPKAVVEDMRKYIETVLDVPLTPTAAPKPVEKIVQEYVTLNHAGAEDVVEFLRNVYFPHGGRHADMETGKIRKIVSHPTLPKVLLVGETQMVAEIKKQIETELDVAGAQAAEQYNLPLKRKYIQLDYIDAVEFNKVLQNDETLHDLEDKLISVVAPNNTIIVSTRYPKEVFARVEEMQKAFDIDRMEIRYYRLRNAKAKEISTLITQVYAKVTPETAKVPEEIQRVRQERTTFGEGEDIEALTDQMRAALELADIEDVSVTNLLGRAITPVVAGEVTIIPDEPRNALLIYTFSRNYPKLLELIDRLDQPVDQVLIDVFITLVSLDDTLELGADITYTDDVAFKEGKYILDQDFDISLRQGGLTYQFISADLNAFLRALQKTGKVDIVAQPTIMTMDNSQAKIELGNQVPLVKEVKVSTEGVVSSAIQYKDVVTSLTVTPQIHPDNYVSLKIEQEINDISAETVQISRDFNPQLLIKRGASTQLRVKDGQTVCLGGFITEDLISTEEKVPLIGDIPVLGYLFKFDTEQRVKNELIIFITPHILTTPTEMLRATNLQRARSDAGDSVFRDQAVLEPQEELRYPPFRDARTGITVVQEGELGEELGKEKEQPAPKPEAKKDAPKPEEKPKPAPKPEEKPQAQKEAPAQPAPQPAEQKPPAKE